MRVISISFGLNMRDWNEDMRPLIRGVISESVYTPTFVLDRTQPGKDAAMSWATVIPLDPHVLCYIFDETNADASALLPRASKKIWTSLQIHFYNSLLWLTEPNREAELKGAIIHPILLNNPFLSARKVVPLHLSLQDMQRYCPAYEKFRDFTARTPRAVPSLLAGLDFMKYTPLQRYELSIDQPSYQYMYNQERHANALCVMGSRIGVPLSDFLQSPKISRRFKRSVLYMCVFMCLQGWLIGAIPDITPSGFLDVGVRPLESFETFWGSFAGNTKWAVLGMELNLSQCVAIVHNSFTPFFDASNGTVGSYNDLKAQLGWCFITLETYVKKDNLALRRALMQAGATLNSILAGAEKEVKRKEDLSSFCFYMDAATYKACNAKVSVCIANLPHLLLALGDSKCIRNATPLQIFGGDVAPDLCWAYVNQQTQAHLDWRFRGASIVQSAS